MEEQSIWQEIRWGVDDQRVRCYWKIEKWRNKRGMRRRGVVFSLDPTFASL